MSAERWALGGERSTWRIFQKPRCFSPWVYSRRCFLFWL